MKLSLILSVVHGVTVGGLDTCDAVTGVIIGESSISQHSSSSAEECCNRCEQTSACVAYTYATSKSTCFLKDNIRGNLSQDDRISGTVTRPAQACASDTDCELLGHCVQGSCVCSPGFKGPSCGQLDFTPASTDESIVWPQLPSVLDNSSMSWGFTMVYAEEEDVYHAVVNAGCCRSSSCSVYVDGTHLVHLTSKDPTQGFQVVGSVAPPTAFNPHLIRAPNGTYILYFRVNDLNNYTVCRGDGTSEYSSDLRTYIPRNQLTPGGDNAPGVNMYVAWADSMTGPWSVQKVAISGMGRVHISNPSIALLSAGSPWTVMLAYRFNIAGGEQNGFAVADSFQGPFRSIANLTKAPGNDEDPFLWQDSENNYHIVYHNSNHGYHAFSHNGLDWYKSPMGAHAFELQVAMDDGSTYSFARRERPEIFFVKGRPAFLYNGVNTVGGALPGNISTTGSAGSFSRSFSFVQPFNGVAVSPLSV